MFVFFLQGSQQQKEPHTKKKSVWNTWVTATAESALWEKVVWNSAANESRSCIHYIAFQGKWSCLEALKWQRRPYRSHDLTTAPGRPHKSGGLTDKVTNLPSLFIPGNECAVQHRNWTPLGQFTKPPWATLWLLSPLMNMELQNLSGHQLAHHPRPTPAHIFLSPAVRASSKTWHYVRVHHFHLWCTNIDDW